MMKFSRSAKKKSGSSSSSGGGGPDPPPSSTSSGTAAAAASSSSGPSGISSHNRVGAFESSGTGISGGGGHHSIKYQATTTTTTTTTTRASSSTSRYLQQSHRQAQQQHPQQQQQQQRRSADKSSSTAAARSASGRSNNPRTSTSSSSNSDHRHVNGGGGGRDSGTTAPISSSSSSSSHPYHRQQQQHPHEKAAPSSSSSASSGGRLGAGVAGTLGNAITSGLGSLTMHARGGAGSGSAGGIVSSRSSNDGGVGGAGRHRAPATATPSSHPSQHQQQQQQPPSTTLAGRRNSNSSSTRGGKSSAQSVVSIGSTSVFAPSIIGTSTRSGNGELQPSSARLLRDLNKSAQSSLLSSLGTAAASRTFRSYKMMLPRYVPRMAMMSTAAAGAAAGGIGADEENKTDGTAPPIETDLELLGRTVHAVSSALTEPPRVGDRYMIYDVSFNPRGCVWDASVVVYDDEDDDEEDGEEEEDEMKNGIDRSTTSRTSRTGGGGGGTMNKKNSGGTFTFPIRITCAEDEDDECDDDHYDEEKQDREEGTPSQPRAKTYAVELSIIEDSVHNLRNAADHRDVIKNSVEWISYGIRRSMARSMFPEFPEGCRGRPFREIYQLNKKIKSGTFSTVCRGVHRDTGRQVAVKCILRKKIDPSVDAAVFEEVLIMSGLHHKYICPMIDYFEEDRCHFVVMELERGGDLCERLNEKGTYPEDEARVVIRNMCEAMDFVHSKGFAHCDIKPRNYLLRSKKDDLDIRLADFGFAQHVHAPNSLTSQCGTPFFVAPEVINRKPYDQKVDMWSIGVTTYLLLSGDTPFNGKNRQQLFRRISCDDPPFPDEKWDKISYEALDFVRKLLNKDPAKRLSAKQALSHLWLRGIDNRKATAQQQSRQKSSTAQTGGVGESNAEASSRKPGGSSRKEQAGEPKSPRSPVHGSGANRHGNESSPSQIDGSNRSGSNDRAKSRSASGDRTEKNTLSREQIAKSSRGVPPPPPKPQPQAQKSATSRVDRGGAAVANQILHNFGNSAEDVNAKLLDVIKDQDAKIEKLERLVKQMLEPEGNKHER